MAAPKAMGPYTLKIPRLRVTKPNAIFASSHSTADTSAARRSVPPGMCVRGNVEAFAFAGILVVLAIVSLAVSFTAGPFAPLLGLAVGYVPFFVVYRFIPRTQVRGRTLRLAALVSAVLWEAAKIGFGFVTRSLGIFSVYGPIAFGAAMLTWIYVTAAIILVGAEVIKVKRAAHGTP